jgi:hypothetical protein
MWSGDIAFRVCETTPKFTRLNGLVASPLLDGLQKLMATKETAHHGMP